MTVENAIPDTAIHPDGYTPPPIPPAGQAIPVEQDVQDFQDAVQHPGVDSVTSALNDAASLEQTAAPLIQETRRGWKTTEFWSSLAVVFADVATSLPAKDKLLVTILGGAYAVARGIAKNGIPNIVPPEAPKE